jgi:hypothetical protein
MNSLVSNKELLGIAEDFHVLEGEIPSLVRLLQHIREFQENIKLLPVSSKKQQLLKLARDIDNIVACEILQGLTKAA